MTIQKFIDQNRAKLTNTINGYLNYIPKSASCDCPKSGTNHYHNDHPARGDDELRAWVLNDEGLYSWAKSDDVDMDDEDDS